MQRGPPQRHAPYDQRQRDHQRPDDRYNQRPEHRDQRYPEQQQRQPDQRQDSRYADQRYPDQRQPDQRYNDQRQPEQRYPDQRSEHQRQPEQRRPEQQRQPEQRPRPVPKPLDVRTSTDFLKCEKRLSIKEIIETIQVSDSPTDLDFLSSKGLVERVNSLRVGIINLKCRSETNLSYRKRFVMFQMNKDPRLDQRVILLK